MANRLCLSGQHFRICSHKHQHGHRSSLVRRLNAVPDLNPQNVPDPKIMPSPDFSAEEAVRIQLEALQHNNKPWSNHGIQTAYEFGEDIGGMERSRYFGYSKDLYHFDHFLGQFQNAFPTFVLSDDFQISSVEEHSQDAYSVMVEVQKGGTQSKARFHMLRKDIGRKKGSLMTKSVQLVSE